MNPLSARGITRWAGTSSFVRGTYLSAYIWGVPVSEFFHASTPFTSDQSPYSFFTSRIIATHQQHLYHSIIMLHLISKQHCSFRKDDEMSDLVRSGGIERTQSKEGNSGMVANIARPIELDLSQLYISL